MTLFIDTFTPTWPVISPDGTSRLTYLGASLDQFQLEVGGVRIGGPWFRRGQTPTGAQTGLQSFWAWSPDGLFFAVVVRDQQASGGAWWLDVYATRQYTRGNGVQTIPRGAVYSASGVSAASNVIAGVNLGWNDASTCLELRPPPMFAQPPTQSGLTLICPFADSASSTARADSRTLDSGPLTNPAGWDYRHSPCGGLFALIPKPRAGTSQSLRELEIIDIRRSLNAIQQRRDNLLVGPAVVNAVGATVTTVGPGRRGISLTNMSLTEIDNPECSAGSPARVDVRRVRVSTVPNQIDYTNLGQAIAAIWPNDSLWVEFPSLAWVNPAGAPGQLHYCLQANGDASPADPSPGWANINLSDRHFAQRNIVFA